MDWLEAEKKTASRRCEDEKTEEESKQQLK